jgi:transposase
MTKKATHSKQYSVGGQTLFLAFELGASEWKLGMTVGLGQKPRRRTVPARNLEKLEGEIGAAKKRFRLSENALVVSCYEAGRDGFWIHRYLEKSGIRNVVVDSSSIEVNRKSRRAKTDQLDVQKLLTMLIRYEYGERKVWSVVRVPSVEEEDQRQLHRELRTLNKEKNRATNRIRGLLASQGIRPPTVMDLSDTGLSTIRLWDGAKLPAGLMGRLKREWDHVLFLKRQIRDLEVQRRGELKQSENPGVEKVKQLAQLRGIGAHGGWVLVQEFFGWRKFQNGREVGSLAGLTPTPYQSGESRREQGISKAGNRYVRGIVIELAWSWLRYQPDSKLSRWYLKRFADAGMRARKVGIVAVARRLLIDLWRFLETGVIPEGAELKATVK